MKRNVLILLFGLLLFVGCGKTSTASNLNIKGASAALDQKYDDVVSMDDPQLKTVYGLDLSLLDEYEIKTSNLANGDFYAILKVSSENKKKVQDQMNQMFQIMEKQSNLYSPEAVKLIKGRLETSVGNYLIYIISSDNNSMYNVIKEYIS